MPAPQMRMGLGVIMLGYEFYPGKKGFDITCDFLR